MEPPAASSSNVCVYVCVCVVCVNPKRQTPKCIANDTRTHAHAHTHTHTHTHRLHLLRELFLSTTANESVLSQRAGTWEGGGGAAAGERATSAALSAREGRGGGRGARGAARSGAGGDGREIHENIHEHVVCDGCQMHPIVGTVISISNTLEIC